MSVHAKVVNAVKYHDRTVQDWHRDTFNAGPGSEALFSAIDLDLMGSCPVCRLPLYLIEATENPEKHTSILRGLSDRAQTEGLVVFHDTGDVTGAKRVWPNDLQLLGEDAVRFHLLQLRKTHLVSAHPKAAEWYIRKGLLR
jgi:hypothetical protein